MVVSAPSQPFQSVFDNVGAQGSRFDAQLSPSDIYVAFLSKADLSTSDSQTPGYDVLFELVPIEWVVNVLVVSSSDTKYPIPQSPATLYHMQEIEPNALLQALGLKSDDDLAEGSWYYLKLVKGSTPPLVGDLYDPDLDMKGMPKFTGSPEDYQEYTLMGAQLVAIPTLTSVGIDWFGKPPKSPDVAETFGTGGTGGTGGIMGMPIVADNDQLIRKRLRGRSSSLACPTVKMRRVQPPPVPPVASVGVMDVGIGNCNMLLDQGPDPLIYYDIGFPLFFYRDSAPPGLTPAAWLGPILTNNATGNLVTVVLSHWDWDHWRLGRIASMQNHPWIVPRQPFGFAANNFFLTLTNVQVYAGAAVANGNGYTVYRCVPPPGSPPAVVLNNSGLALRLDIRLPSTGLIVHSLYVTADANFTSLPVAVQGDTAAIVAVHHGSNNHGAAANLPAPDPRYPGTGRVVYSYGVRAANGRHPYGFPVAAAVAAYQASGWTAERSTAEGANINAAPPAVLNRGNNRMGDPTLLGPAYANTAFSAFPNGLNS